MLNMNNFSFKRKIGRASVKEGFDNLPSAICFADRSGTVVLCNRLMDSLCHRLTGADLQHISELRNALENPAGGAETEDGQARIYRFHSEGGKEDSAGKGDPACDGGHDTFWQFTETQITDADGRQYTQMQAIDVTQLHLKTMELKEENRLLDEANIRAMKLYGDIDRIVREKETLAMKMRVHDDMGMCLLATRNLLTKESTLEEYLQGARRWQKTLEEILAADRTTGKEGICTVDPARALDELLEAAGKMGLAIELKGDLPESERKAYMMVVAMRECTTNALRHAGASQMTVNLTRAAGSDTLTITNDGRPPKGKIIEGGGLSGLRRSIENMGGIMKTEGRPRFKLTVILPDTGSEEENL